MWLGGGNSKGNLNAITDLTADYAFVATLIWGTHFIISTFI